MNKLRLKEVKYLAQSNTAGEQNQDLNPHVCDFGGNGTVKKWSRQVREGRELIPPAPRDWRGLRD